MGNGSLSLFTAMKQKMHWHQTRQGVLAENVANAETPGYRGRDLKSFNFADHVRQTSTAQVSTKKTHSGHFAVSSSSVGGFAAKRVPNFTSTPEGNGVTLEDEMIKISQNQMDYQAVTTLYTRSMRLLRTALGR